MQEKTATLAEELNDPDAKHISYDDSSDNYIGDEADLTTSRRGRRRVHQEGERKVGRKARGKVERKDPFSIELQTALMMRKVITET